jgi:hypothetical protein
MGLPARGAECRRAHDLCLISVCCAALVLAVPVSAVARAPAQRQYVLPHPRATGSGNGVPGKHSAVPGSYGHPGNAALPSLLGGLGLIGGGAALTAYRRRRNPARPE